MIAESCRLFPSVTGLFSAAIMQCITAIASWLVPACSDLAAASVPQRTSELAPNARYA